MPRKIIYLDHAATTPLNKEVFEEMLPFFEERYGNASSIHILGRESKKAVEISRERIAKSIGCSEREIYFTSSGTEADNWAIKGAAFASRNKGKHIITSSIEHHAVLHACQYLEGEGFEVTYLPVDEYGMISLNALEKAIRNDTILISIMAANNEVGTIQPINEISRIAQEKEICFHTDAVQAIGTLPIDVNELKVDMMSISGHKFYGPKGVGALYIRKRLKFPPFIHGGAQERKKRGGTENVPSIVGMGKAIEIAVRDMEKNKEYLIGLRNSTIKKIMGGIPYVRLNGHPKKRLPGNMNFSFEFAEGESILLMLDKLGIAASSGSACASGSLDPSHVLLAMGLPHEIAHGAIRFSLGVENTREEMDYLVKNLKTIIERLRQLSPLYTAK